MFIESKRLTNPKYSVHPLYVQVWKYTNTERIVESSLEQINILVNREDGPEETDILLTGGASGTLWYALLCCLNTMCSIFYDLLNSIFLIFKFPSIYGF